jgi:hypothetical protein
MIYHNRIFIKYSIRYNNILQYSLPFLEKKKIRLLTIRKMGTFYLLPKYYPSPQLLTEPLTCLEGRRQGISYKVPPNSSRPSSPQALICFAAGVPASNHIQFNSIHRRHIDAIRKHHANQKNALLPGSHPPRSPGEIPRS